MSDNLKKVMGLKKEIEEAKKDRDRKLGSLDELKKQLLEFEVETLDEARELYIKSIKEKEKLEKELQNRIDKLESDLGDE